MELITDPGAISQLNQQATQQGGSGFGADPTNGLQGPELLKHFEKTQPTTAAMVKSIIAGDVSAKGRNLQAYMPYAALVDPTLNQSDYDTRAKTRAAYTGAGKPAAELRAIDTAIGHADQLHQINDKYGNTNFLPGIINPALNAVRGQVSPDFQKLRGDREAHVEALAGEMAKAFNGGQTALADRQHWRDILNGAKGPAEMQSVITSAMDLLKSRLESHESSYNEGMGRTENGIQFLKPNRRAIFERLSGREMAPEGAAAPAGKPQAAPLGPAVTPGPAGADNPALGFPEGSMAQNPKTGEKMIFKGGQWRPM